MRMESAKLPRSSMLETNVARFMNRVVIPLFKVFSASRKDSSFHKRQVMPSISSFSLSYLGSVEGPGIGSASAIASSFLGSKSGYLFSKAPKRPGQSNWSNPSLILWALQRGCILDDIHHWQRACSIHSPSFSILSRAALLIM